ncbi:MAG: class I SAM-dependent methyltransferase [Anaerolineales bacterium]|jgi:ubiquinone/menaquinone biosynthesis C-methylase UbiE
MKRKLALILGSLLVFFGALIYQNRRRARVPGWESLEDPSIAAAFNRIAAWPQMRLLRWYMVRLILRFVQQGQVVDIGCGPGHLVFELARRAPGMQITGVDLSDQLLLQAEQAAARQDTDHRVQFKKGDALELPFPDASLDLAVTTLSLHHWSQPVAVLNEIARVLRPGGAFLIFDLRRDMAAPFYLLLWFATHLVVPGALRRANEPMGSRDAAYTAGEAASLVEASRLTGWQVVTGPLWLVIEGKTRIES